MNLDSIFLPELQTFIRDGATLLANEIEIYRFYKICDLQSFRKCIFIYFSVKNVCIYARLLKYFLKTA